jgi:hypothetical protein
MRGVLGLKRQGTWFDLPVMMRLTLSTPHHALKNLSKGPLTRPNNFMMLPQICHFGYPQDVDPNKFTLITNWRRNRCEVPQRKRDSSFFRKQIVDDGNISVAGFPPLLFADQACVGKLVKRTSNKSFVCLRRDEGTICPPNGRAA